MSELGDEDLETAAVEETAVTPEIEKNAACLHHFARMFGEHAQKLGLAMREFYGSFINAQLLGIDIQVVTADGQCLVIRLLVRRSRSRIISPCACYEGIDAYDEPPAYRRASSDSRRHRYGTLLQHR